jgi:RHS repeat-associated protein
MKKLFWFCLLGWLCAQAETRLPIERLQREMQIRYNHLSQAHLDHQGRYWFLSETPQNPAVKIIWPKTVCSDVPPAFPPDLFYGDELLPEETLYLVGALLNTLEGTELWKYYVTLNTNTSTTTPRTRPEFLDSPLTQENCNNLFYAVESFVASLNDIRSYPDRWFRGLSGRWSAYYRSVFSSSRQAFHEGEYNSLRQQIFDSPNPEFNGFLGVDWLPSVEFFGVLYGYKQWTDPAAWENVTETLGERHEASDDPDMLYFIQGMSGNVWLFSQPDFWDTSYRKAELYLRVDEVGSGGIYPTGFTSDDMNVLRHHQTLYPGEQSEHIYTAIDDLPDCPDPLEGSPRVAGWKVNVDETFAVVTMNYKPVGDSMTGCSSCIKIPGGVSTELNSLHVQIGLGTDAKGHLSGVLELTAHRSGADVVSPDRLKLQTTSADVTQTDYGTYRVVYAPQSAVVIEAYADGTYTGTRVTVYACEDLAAAYMLKGYVWTVVQANDPFGDVFVIESESGKWTTFSPLGNGEWSKTISKSGQTVSESIDRVTDGLTNFVTRTQSDPVYGEVLRTIETYLDFDWGRELVRTERGSGSNAPWTAYEYITDTNTAGYGQMKSVISSDGGWERYEYAENGDPFKTISSFGDQPADASETLCRVRMTGTVQSGNEQITTDIEELRGVEISRSYTVRTTNETRTVRCATAGAAMDAVGNQISVTRYIQDPNDGSPFTGKKVSKIEHADGTLTLKEYPNDSTDITWRGASNSGGTVVADGTRTVEIRNDFGYVIDRKVYDIASGTLIDSEIVTGFHFDGRPVQWQYLDETTRDIEIGCCGIDRETRRDGSMQFYDFYDPNGHPAETETENADGEPVIQLFRYDAAGNLRRRGFRINGADNWLETFVYDSAGRMTAGTNALGGATTVTETTNGSRRVRTTVFPDLGTQIEEFYADGQLYRRTGTAVPHVRMEYGLENGEAFTKTIQLGDNGETTLWSKTFSDFLGRPYKTLYSDGSFEQSGYNDKGQVEKTVDRAGVVTLFTYNAKGEREVMALDKNQNDTIDYSGMDRIIKTTTEVTAARSTHVRRTTTQIWDVDNADTSRTTAVQEQSVDGLQRWSTVEGQETHSVTVYTPSEAKRTDTVTNPDNTQIITVTVNGQPSAQIWKDSAGATMRTLDLNYNGWGQVEQQVDSQQGTTQLGYTPSGLLASKTRVSRTDSNHTLTESYGYDSSMRITSVTNADNSVTFTDYYPAGQVKKQYGAGTYPVEYGYDVQGRKTTLTTWQNYSSSAGAAVTAWIYNPTNGMLARKEYADSKGTDYEYSPGGRMTARSWERGIETIYLYDTLGQLTNVTYSTADTSDVNYTYDRMGRMKTAGNTHASYEYGYTDGLLATETVNVGQASSLSITRTYDFLNRPSGYSTAGVSPARSVTYGYDTAGRFSTITSSVSSVSSVVNYSYDPATGLSTGHSVGIAGFQPALTVTKGYDGFNRLGGVSNTTLTGSTPSTISTYTYTHNDLGQRTSMQMNFGTNGFSSAWNYQYDTLGQLSNAWKTANGSVVPGRQYGYEFDDIGNRKQTTRGNNSSGLLIGTDPLVTSDYTANLLNQYSHRTVPAYAEISGTANPEALLSFRNENTGTRIRAGRNDEWFHAFMPLSDNSTASVSNTVRMTAVLPEQGTAGADLINTNQTITLTAMKTPEVFTYDDDGNLLSDGRFDYTWNAENRLICASNQNTVATYKYDHQGRRVSKNVNGETTTFLWSGNYIIGEYSSSQTNSFVWGNEAHLVSASLSGTNVFYAHDGNKNVTELVDSSGVVIAHYEFDPFGNVVASIGDLVVENPFRFSNEYVDEETGNVAYMMRYLDTINGIWLNRDPIEEQGGVNVYGFVANDPIDSTDQLGLDFISVGTRQVAGSGGLPGFWHMSIQFYETTDLCIQEGDEYRRTGNTYARVRRTSRGGRSGVSLNFVLTEKIELLNNTADYHWISLSGNKPKYKSAAVSELHIDKDPSALVYVVLLADTQNRAESRAAWDRIVSAAYRYRYVSTTRGAQFPSNWPDSAYGYAGNNSNTFIREMARVINRNADQFRIPHMGAQRPSPVTDQPVSPPQHR